LVCLNSGRSSWRGHAPYGHRGPSVPTGRTEGAGSNTPTTLVVRNFDLTPEKFESKTLRVEKVVAGNAEISIKLRPLAPGRYRFYGDFNEATVEGAVVSE
jgi:Cupredoxin-like domain